MLSTVLATVNLPSGYLNHTDSGDIHRTSRRRMNRIYFEPFKSVDCMTLLRIFPAASRTCWISASALPLEDAAP